MYTNGSFKFEIDDMANAAFQDGNAPIVLAKMLEDAAEEIRNGITEGNLRDGSNGPAVGEWLFEPPIDEDKKEQLEQLEKDWEGFKSLVDSGITIDAHSGVNGQPKTIAYTVQDWYNADEIDCEESFANMKTSSMDVSVEDILDGEVDFDDECEYDGCD